MWYHYKGRLNSSSIRHGALADDGPERRGAPEAIPASIVENGSGGAPYLVHTNGVSQLLDCIT